MQAYFDKAWASRRLGETGTRIYKLSLQRSGLHAEPGGVNPARLAELMQEIARARIEELHLQALIRDIESRVDSLIDMKMPEKTVSLGSLPDVPRLAPAKKVTPQQTARLFPVALMAMQMARPR